MANHNVLTGRTLRLLLADWQHL